MWQIWLFSDGILKDNVHVLLTMQPIVNTKDATGKLYMHVYSSNLFV